MSIAFQGGNTPMTQKLDVMLQGVKALMNVEANNFEN